MLKLGECKTKQRKGKSSNWNENKVDKVVLLFFL